MILRLVPALAIFTAPFFASGQETPAAPAAAAATAEKRALVFHRAETKGAKYEVTAKASQIRTADYHLDGDVRPGGNDSVEVTLDGTMEVTEILPKSGSVSGYTFVIKKMSLTDGSGADDGFEPGTVITAKVEKLKTTFYAHGGEVEGNFETALSLALPSFPGIDEPLDDVFAPQGPVAPGGKWEPDQKKIAEVLKKSEDVDLDAAKSTTRARYKGPSAAAGIESDVVVISQTCVFSKVPGLPEDAKLESAQTTCDTTFSLARDVKTAASPEMRSVSDTNFRYSGKHEGKDYSMDYKTHNERHLKMKPVK